MDLTVTTGSFKFQITHVQQPLLQDYVRKHMVNRKKHVDSTSSDLVFSPPRRVRSYQDALYGNKNIWEYFWESMRRSYLLSFTNHCYCLVHLGMGRIQGLSWILN